MPTPSDGRRVVHRRPVGAPSTRQDGDTVDAGPATIVSDDTSEHARREAYERGVREGRRSGKSNPLLTLIVIALAALGLVFVGLWIRSGSPSQAGAQIGTAAVVAGDRVQEGAEVVGDRAQQEIGERTDGDPATPPPATGSQENPTPSATTTTTTTETRASPDRQ